MPYLDKTQQKLFISFLIVKIFLAYYFVGKVNNLLAISFLDSIIERGSFFHAYRFFDETTPPLYFPYGGVMVYLFTALRYPFYGNAIGVNQELIFKMIFLISDCILCYVLLSWFRQRARRVLWYYWVSPIVLYLSYIRGEMDSLPLMLVLVATFYLLKNKYIRAILFLVLAASSKSNIFLIIPFFFAYIYTNEKRVYFTLQLIGLFIGGFLLMNAPFIMDPAFVNQFFFGYEQLKVFSVFFNQSNQYFYILPALFMMMLYVGFNFRFYNRHVLLFLITLTFSLFILLIKPNSAWYLWIFPFFAYFYIQREEKRDSLLFVAFQFAFLIYFMIDDNRTFVSEWLDVTKPLGDMPSYKIINFVQNINYTVLQTLLIINCIWLYNKFSDFIHNTKLLYLPYLIGIGGNSGVGKTTISEAIKELFTESNTLIVSGDDSHKWERGNGNWKILTHLNPKANRLSEEVNCMKLLLKGKSVYRRFYDHSIGRFTEPKKMYAKKLNVYEGLHALYLKEFRDLIDLKLFIQPEPSLALYWKISRDKVKRNYTLEQVIEKIKERELDAQRFIETQAQYSDIILNIIPYEPIKDFNDTNQDIQVYYRLDCNNTTDYEGIVERLKTLEGLDIQHEYSSIEKQTLTLKGTVDSERLVRLMYEEFSEVFEELGVYNLTLPKGLFGVVIVLIVYNLFDHDKSREFFN